MTKPKSSYVISYNDVTSLNFDTYFPEIMKKISNASHVAVDLEFTSLGNVRSVDMNHRYVAMKQTVESAAIASIGLSIVRNVGSKIQITSSQSDLTSGSCSLPDLQIFPNTALPNLDGSCFLPDLTAEQDNKTNDKQLAQKYVCDNYNLLTLKQGNINIQSSTGTFLCNHGYSFDALFTQGIPFTPPGDITKNTQDKRLNNLWKKIMTAMRLHNTPLILHNGLYDMVYLYHSFIDQLPDTFGRFLVQVSEHFPSGLYDTRYLADKADFDATFLAYVFSKSDRLRQNRFQNSTEQEPYFEVQVNQPMLAKKILGVKRKRILEQDEDKKTSYCRPYADRGYCVLGHGDRNPLHDLQIILDSQMGPSEYPQVYTSKLEDEEGTHAAHFDAYMTGFNFCYFENTFSPIVMKSCLNKMTVSGSDFPLTFPMTKSKNQR